MPFFGVDDVLLLLASTTAALWVKRTELIQAGVYGAVNFMTHDPTFASKCASDVARKYDGPPLLLLKGFDLQTAKERSGSFDYLKRLTTLALDELKLSPVPSQEKLREGLVRTSLVSEYVEHPVVHKVPNIPHRYYNHRKQLPHVTALINYTEEEVSSSIRGYSVTAVKCLFDKMESEGRWEAIVRVSRGIDRAQLRLKYLTQRNVESALRTLVNCATSTLSPVVKPDLPLMYYFTFAEDMLLSDEIIIALFDLCRYNEMASLELYKSLLPFRTGWSPKIYACCLTITACYNYEKAFELYEQYLQAQRRSEKEHRTLLYPIKQALLSSSMPDDEPLPRRGTGLTKLQYLYHIMVPLVVAREPAKAGQYIDDMMANDPSSAPDVFLKCLANDTGRSFTEAYIEEIQKKSGGSSDATLRVPDSHLEGSPHDQWSQNDLAFSLYALKPSAMNMNSLLRVILGAKGAPKTQAVPFASSINATHSIASLPRQGPEQRLGGLFESVPLASLQDALILARSIAENSTSSVVAELFLNAMIRRKHFAVVPILAFHLAGQGHWAIAVRAMTIYLSNQRGLFSSEEICFCVEASVRTEQWSGALFWVERAHAKGLKLPIKVYDSVFSSSKHWTWQDALRVLKGMQAVGGMCSNEGFLNLLRAATKSGSATNALHEFSSVIGA